MIQLSLEMIRAIQSDYEREVEQMRLRKLARTLEGTSPFSNKLEWLAKDITQLVLRLITRKRKIA